MQLEKVYEMKIARVYPLLLAKVERKGRSKEELDAVIAWLCGYSPEALERLMDEDWSYREFFAKAPAYNAKAAEIKGVICGVRVEAIEEPLMKQIRQLDKLVDELAKGKSLEKILRS